MSDHHPVTIYCDGCCEPNPGIMGIGVYWDDPVIRSHKVVGHGTNNQAECLAAIVALEEPQGRYCFEELERVALPVQDDQSGAI
jgi:ribonuclease HI